MKSSVILFALLLIVCVCDVMAKNSDQPSKYGVAGDALVLNGRPKGELVCNDVTRGRATASCSEGSIIFECRCSDGCEDQKQMNDNTCSCKCGKATASCCKIVAGK
ncbi:resistin-like beta [Protopterus annectens]|uniref:resistin-like beta n=1 Tax=Protopterus annectens TaxID=7888 RepID=UPI001CF9C36B|nr:resistin-like beta [Protopterus annectens]